MTPSLRSQRLAQRLSSSAIHRPTASARRSFFSNDANIPGACILCQIRSQSTTVRPTQTTNLPQQTIRFASTATHNNNTNGNGNGNINALDITNHYTIFPKTIPAGPPPASPFEIPLDDLKREFLRLQGATHPDKFPTGPEKKRAEGLSARINEAYRTLVDPLQRAQYLLREMHGIDVTAEDGAAKHALDPETLMAVMEVQEMIEEVGREPEAEGTIAALKKENDVRIVGCVKKLAEAFERGDIEAARQECVRLRFWYSVGEGLREWEPGTTQIRLIH